MRLPAIKVPLGSNSFITGLLSTVLGIVLTFGTTYLVEQRTDNIHKRQLLISMVIYLDNQEQELMKDSIEATRIDSMLGPRLMYFAQTGVVPDREDMNDNIMPLFGSFRNHSGDESNRQYFEGNTEVMQLMDIYTINRFNMLASAIKFTDDIYMKRDKAREELNNWVAAKAFSGKMQDEKYKAAALEELMTHPMLSVFYLTNLEYKEAVCWLLPIWRAARQAILNVNHLNGEDFVRFYDEDPYAQELMRLLNGQYDENIDLGTLEFSKDSVYIDKTKDSTNVDKE